MNKYDIVTIIYYPPEAIVYDHNGKCLTVLNLQEAIKYAKTLQYDEIWVFMGDTLMETIIKRRTMKTSEKIEELLGFNHFVLVESEDDDPTIVFAKINDCFISSETNGNTFNLDSDYFDDLKNPKISIYPKKYKVFKVGDRVYNLATYCFETIEHKNGNIYSTDKSDDIHITNLVPAWYKQEEKETITIGGHTYLKDDVEEALKDLEEVE